MSVADLRDAVMAARKRLRDKSLGTVAEGGKYRVVTVGYPKRLQGRAMIAYLTDPVTTAEAIAYLNGLKKGDRP